MNLIYLEVIELNFCELNKNVKRKIQKRGDIDNEDLKLGFNLKDDFLLNSNDNRDSIN